MVACGDVVVPDLASDDNIASKAVRACAALGRDDAGIEIRIEKNIPRKAGLGGGSSDAAAALVGAARLWGIDPNDPAIEQTARQLGSDVAFFLHGGCSCYEGTGDVFIRAVEPSKRSVALVKPEGGVSTARGVPHVRRDPLPIPEQRQTRCEPLRLPMTSRCSTTLRLHLRRSCPSLPTSAAWLESNRASRSAALRERRNHVRGVR